MLKVPCPTRWNSMYDSLDWFLKHYKSLDNLNFVATSIGLPKFNDVDLEILADYCMVQDPLARVLDVFQGGKQVFLGLGIVLPLLTKLKEQLRGKNFKYVNPIRDVIIEKLEER